MVQTTSNVSLSIQSTIFKCGYLMSKYHRFSVEFYDFKLKEIPQNMKENKKYSNPWIYYETDILDKCCSRLLVFKDNSYYVWHYSD